MDLTLCGWTRSSARGETERWKRVGIVAEGREKEQGEGRTSFGTEKGLTS